MKNTNNVNNSQINKACKYLSSLVVIVALGASTMSFGMMEWQNVKEGNKIVIVATLKSGLDKQNPFKAISENDVKAFEKIINNKEFDIYQKNKLGETLLISICKKNNTEMVELFIDKISLIDDASEELTNTSGEDREMPIFWACEHGNLKIAKLLLENGARKSIENIDKLDCSAVYAAIRKEHTKLVELMIDNGAAIKEREIQVAKKRNNNEILKMLKIKQ